MRFSTLLRRNLGYYWRTNLAVLAGVAVTVAVLAGALLVGDSVRATLRGLVLRRLGNTTHVITNENFFREQLAGDLRSQLGFAQQFSGAAPMMVLEGAVTHQESNRRAGSVQVYGVDERFWQFHGRPAPATLAAGGRDALLSPALAREFGAAVGDTILLRLQRPSDIPVESLHGRRDQLGRTIRLTVRGIPAADELGEFSLRPQQGEVRAIFVSLERLQRDLGVENQANTILLSEAAAPSSESEEGSREIARGLKEGLSLDDAGLRVSTLPNLTHRFHARLQSGLSFVDVPYPASVSLESRNILMPDAAAGTAHKVAEELGWQEQRLFTYLANTIRIGTREIPYSLISALDQSLLAQLAGAAPISQQKELAGRPPVWLNDWAARDLGAKLGDTVTLEYYVWQEGGGLRTESAEFTLADVIPLVTIVGDKHLAPDFPGIADSASVSD